MEPNEIKSASEEFLKTLRGYAFRAETTGRLRRDMKDLDRVEILAVRNSKTCDYFSWLKNRQQATVVYKGVDKVTLNIRGYPTQIDVYLCIEDSWGIVQLYLTGCQAYQNRVRRMLKKNGLFIWDDPAARKSFSDYIRNNSGKCIPVKEEISVFDLIKLPYVEPERRNQ